MSRKLLWDFRRNGETLRPIHTMWGGIFWAKDFTDNFPKKRDIHLERIS